MAQEFQLPEERIGLSETTRLEAFSDGVLAIAITLLILEIRPPLVGSDSGALWSALANQWTAYVAYLAGFFTIGIMWINHHRMFNLISKTDDWLLILNGLLLLAITFINFPTFLLSQYLGTPNATAAMVVYGGTTVMIAIFYNLLWRYAVRANLIDPAADLTVVTGISSSYWFGPVFYGIAFGLAFINVYLSLAVCTGLAIFFALPPRKPKPAAAK